MNKLLCFSLVSLTCYLSLPQNNYLAKAESNEIIINQTVDDDLKSFDLRKYYVDPSFIIEPTLIYFNEAYSNKHLDLVYFYDPNNAFDYGKLSYQVCYSSSETIVDDVINDTNKNNRTYFYYYTKDLIFAGTSSDKKVKRFAFYQDDEEINNRKSYDYHYYKMNKIDSTKLNNEYLFKKDNVQEVSNDLNVVLGDPHVWSWNFDEDSTLENVWEEFLALFVGQDTLRNQLFYSFYVDNWLIKDIKAIEMQYKKVLFDGSRAGPADTDEKNRAFMGKCNEEFTYRPSFYKWKDTNSKDNYDKTEYLGSTLEEIAPNVDYEIKVITPDEVTSKGMDHDYSWSKIQTINDLKRSFGESSKIYKFASTYFNDTSKNYWIINFEDFYYSYKYRSTIEHSFKKTSFEDGHIWSHNNANNPEAKIRIYNDGLEDFEKFLIENFQVNFFDNNGVSIPEENLKYTVDMYNVTQEYVFQVAARKITFTDYFSKTRTLPVSVTPVNQESTGGFSEDPKSFWDLLRKIIMVILGLLIIIPILIILWPLISLILKLIVKIITFPFKLLLKKK